MIGELHDNWTMRRIGELCRLVNGRAFKPNEWGTVGLPIIRIQNLNDERKAFNCYSGTPNAKHLVDPGDVLLSWSGTPGTSFGCFIWTRKPGVLNQHIFKVHVNESLCSKEFFVHAVNSALKEMIAAAHGGVGLRHITKHKLEQIELPIAPLTQQRTIVSKINHCLQRLAEVTTIHGTVQDIPTHVRGAYILERLGLDSLRDWRDAYFHKGEFQWTPIEDLCSVVARGRHSKQGSSRTSLIKTRHVWPDGVRDYSDCLLDEAEALRLRDALVVRQHDVLLACSARGSLGRSCYISAPLENKATVDTHVAILRTDPKRVLPRFLFEFLNSPLGRYLLVSAEAGGRWHEEKIGFRFAELNLQDLKQIKIPVPPPDRQNDLLAKLARLDQLMEPMLAELRKVPSICEASREAVLRQAFAGEL